MKLDKDHHGLGITIAGYTDQTGSFLGLHLLHCPFSLTVVYDGMISLYFFAVVCFQVTLTY